MVRWAAGTDPREALSALAPRDPSGLCAAEAARLADPPQPPPGWDHHPLIGRKEIYAPSEHGHHGRLPAHRRHHPQAGRCAAHADAEAALVVAARRAPLRLPEDTTLTHDYLSVALEFDDGQDLTWHWSSSCRRLRLPLPLEHWRHRETHIVARSGMADLGRWIDEERPVLADHQVAIGGPAPSRVVRAWPISVSCFQMGEGRASSGVSSWSTETKSSPCSGRTRRRSAQRARNASLRSATVRPMGEHQVAIVGAGPSGIAAAVALKDRGVTPLLIDRAEAVGSSWRSRYDRLRLNTGPPVLPPSRSPVSQGHADLPHPRPGRGAPRARRARGRDRASARTVVERIDRSGSGWGLETSTGPVESRQVVVATGYEHAPLIPEWPGRESFAGEVLHSSEYRNPEPYVGRRVLVVGSGCSGMEIAHDLATGGAAKVWLAVRTPPNIIKRQGPAGLPGDVIATPLYHAPARIADAVARFGRKMDFGDLTEYGLPVPEEGVFTRTARLGVAPAIVDAEVIEAIKAQQIEIVRAMEAFSGGEVVLADGARVDADAVICATGYSRGLEPLVGHLGVLDERGRPRISAKAGCGRPALHRIRPRPLQIGSSAKQCPPRRAGSRASFSRSA